MLGGDICLVSRFSEIHFVKTIIFQIIPTHRKGIRLQVDHLRLCYQIAFTWPRRFYVVALFRVGVFIEFSLLFSWSMSRVRFAQRVWGILYFVFVFVWFDVCVETINVSPQWTCHSLAMSVTLLKRNHLGCTTSLLSTALHPRRIQMKENPLVRARGASRWASAACGNMHGEDERRHLTRRPFRERCYRRGARFTGGLKPSFRLLWEQRWHHISQLTCGHVTLSAAGSAPATGSHCLPRCSAGFMHDQVLMTHFSKCSFSCFYITDHAAYCGSAWFIRSDGISVTCDVLWKPAVVPLFAEVPAGHSWKQRHVTLNVITMRGSCSTSLIVLPFFVFSYGALVLNGAITSLLLPV